MAKTRILEVPLEKLPATSDAGEHLDADRPVFGPGKIFQVDFKSRPMGQ
jgi:hypothetical protein